VDSTRSEPPAAGAGTGALERLAGGLLALMVALTVTCVAAAVGLRWLGSGNPALGTRLLSLATGLVVLAPLVSLSGVALRALRVRRRLGWFAVGALLVTLLGMGLAR
jgi:glucose-6-phosphate-specific signal transduction histidine kinase